MKEIKELLKKKGYQILKRIYDKEGINDGVVYEIVNERFENVSFHKSEELAKGKIKRLKLEEYRKVIE